MKLIKWVAAAAAVVVGVSGANAQVARVPIQRSHNVFHMSVCDRFVARGFARCFAHVQTDARGNIREGKPDGARANVAPAGFSPAQLRSAYRITGTGSSSVTIAVVDAYGYTNVEADLAAYRKQYGLPACTIASGCLRVVDQNGGTRLPRQDVGWAQETALDLDMVSAMCPNCKILLVQANNNSMANLAAAVNTAARLGAHAISNSYGGDEPGTTSYESAYNHDGIAITVSSGDYGYGVQFPASSPHVTAVGGTSLVAGGGTRGWSETAWDGSGSGCSSLYAKPGWQTDALCAGRMVADVSAVADPATGVAVYGPVNNRRSGWQVYGGTSASAPIVAGIYGVNGGGVHYGQNPYLSGSTLFDVTSGSNGSCGGTYFCTAGPNYDGPTGLGSPNGVSGF
jgi:subtilase family serine protease